MLKRLIVLIAFVPLLSSGTISAAQGAGGRVAANCTLEGKAPGKLMFEIKYVNAFPGLP